MRRLYVTATIAARRRPRTFSTFPSRNNNGGSIYRPYLQQHGVDATAVTNTKARSTTNEIIMPAAPTSRAERRYYVPSLKRSMTRGPPSEAARNLVRRLDTGSEHPAAILRELARQGTLTIDALNLLLARLGNNLSKHNRHHRRMYILREPIAKEVLHFLWTRDDLWRAFAWDAHSEQQILCLYALVQGHEHYILDWLHAKVPEPSNVKSMYAKTPHRWRGFLLRCCIEMRCLDASNGSADGPLKLFFDVLEKKKRARSQWMAQGQRADSDQYRTMLISPLPALVYLSKELASEKHPNTSSELYDKFCHVRARLINNETQMKRDVELAKLELTHPTRPSAQKAFRVIEQYYGQPGESFETQRLPETDSAREDFRMLFRRTMLRLKSANRASDADMVAQRYSELVGEPLTFRYRKAGVRTFDMK